MCSSDLVVRSRSGFGYERRKKDFERFYGVDKALYEAGARNGDQVIVNTFIMDYKE